MPSSGILRTTKGMKKQDSDLISLDTIFFDK